MIEDLQRAIMLMRLAAQYVEDDDVMIRYDEANCDGECLAEDLNNAAEALEARFAHILDV